MERSVHDSLSAVKRTLESGRIVPGGGAVETALHIYLEEWATSVGSREQLAIGAFASALLIVPITLAVNAAKDSSELVAQLRSRHALSQRTSEPSASAHGGPPAASAANPNAPAAPVARSSTQLSVGGDGAVDAKAIAKAKGYKNYGLDLVKGKVHDTVKAGVLEPSMSKVKQLKSAVEACVAIMRIDTLIKLDPEQRGDGGDDGHGH
jgi:T-complex protein 1 subunit alpha